MARRSISFVLTEFADGICELFCTFLYCDWACLVSDDEFDYPSEHNDTACRCTHTYITAKEEFPHQETRNATTATSVSIPESDAAWRLPPRCEIISSPD